MSLDLLAKLLEGVRLGTINIEELLDPLVSLRQIEGLYVIGPKEWEKAMIGPNGENPLGLSPGWCSSISLPSEWTVDFFRKLAALCKVPDYQCSPVLILELPDINNEAVSLGNMCKWWGIAHDGYDRGITAHQTHWSNWYLDKTSLDWPFETVVTNFSWRIGYVDFPFFTTRKNWGNQQKAVKERGLTISSAVSDALMMNLMAINYKRFRTNTWARTSTIFDSCPLGVCCGGDGVSVSQRWYPGSAYGSVGAAVAGVPLALIT